MKHSHYLLKFILSLFFLFFYQQQLSADAFAATDLRMSKTVSHSSREVNTNFTYTLKVTNVHASGRARGVTIRDTLPAGVTLVSSSVPSGWSCSGTSDITCSTTSDLTAGNSATVTLTVKSTTSGTKVNEAEASSPSPEVPGNEADNTDSATIDIISTLNADMQITKSAANTVYTDDTIVYTLAVKNNGPDYARNVRVTDSLPGTLTNSSASGSGWSCSSGPNITCTYNAALFTPGDTKYITITAKAPHTPQNVDNTARVTTDSTDSTSGNNQSTKRVAVEQAPVELDLHLGDSADPVNSGDTYKYIVTVDNDSASVTATDIKVVTELNAAVSAGYTGYSGSTNWSCNPISGNNVTCFYTPLDLAPSDTTHRLYLNITAPVTQGTYYSKSKLYHDGTYIESSGENTRIINTSLPADIRVRKTTTKSLVSSGGTFQYIVKVKNLSSTNYAQNVAMTDQLPAHFTFVRFDKTDGMACSHNSGLVSCSIASLKYGLTKTIKIKVKATGIVGGPYTNTAFIGSDNDDNSANNQSSVNVTIERKNINGKAYAQKWSNKNLIAIGDQFYFQIYVKNRFTETIENIIFTDTLPNGVILDHITPKNSSLHCSDNRPTVPTTITCTQASLNAGVNTWARLYVSVPTIAPATSKIFTNTVRVQTSSTNSFSDDTDSDQVEIYDPNAPGNLTITKIASETNLYTDDTFEYTISLKNLSSSYIKDITVTDIFPSEIEILSVDKGDFNTCTTSATNIICTESRLNPLQTQNIVIHARAKNPGVNIRNLVILSAGQDNDSSDNEAEAFIDIIDSSLETDLGVRFRDSHVTIDTDTDFTITIEAKNYGSVDASLLEVNTTLPDDFSQAWNNEASNGIAADLVYIDSTQSDSGWSCNLYNTKIISCTRPSLTAGSRSYIKLKVHTPTQSGWIFTNVHIKSANLDLTTGNDEATQNNLISEAQAGTPAMCYDEPPTYLNCTNGAGVGCKQTITIKNLETSTLYDVRIFLDTTGYSSGYISACGVDGAASGCYSGNDIYFLNGNFEQAIEYYSPYSYSNGATHTIYNTSTITTPIYDGNNLFARYYKSGKNHYGALSPCPLPEPDPGNEPNYNSCGIFPEVLNEGLLNTFAFPAILETNSYNDITTSDLGGADLTDYLYRDITINTDVTFNPTKTYNNTAKKLMLIDHLEISSSNVTVTFNEGNYYINELSVTGDNVTINVNGKVRFFVGGSAKKALNVTNSGFNLNSGGTTSNLYIFATGEIILNSALTSTYNINAYLYSTKTMTINYNANTNQFSGAFSTENTMNVIEDNTVFTYVDTNLETDGYGPCPRSNYGDRNFVLVNPLITRNLLGDIRTVGNTVTCISDDNTINGSCRTDSNTVLNENAYVLYTNIEADEGRNSITVDGSSETVFNSSGALIDIAVDASYTLEVVWAGLYWQGNIHNWNATHAAGNENWLNTTDLTGQTIDMSDASQYGQNSIAFHTPSMADGEYKQVSTTGDFFYDYYPIYETDYSGAPENGGVYSIYTDVTDIIKAEPDPNGEYRIANLQTMKGKEKNLGNFGGWSLVVIYSVIDDPDQKFKNISVYSGYKIISSNHSAATSIAISGFRTPSTLPIESTLSIFAGEGEDENDGDYGHITTSATYNLDPANSNNLFRGIISGDTAGSRTPAYPNTNGIDIQNFDVGGHMNVEESSATIELGTDMDTFFPSMVSFATELHKPNICYDYAIKQNGHFLPVDLPSDGVPDLNQTVLTGQSNPLEFNIYFKNKEGDIQATKLSLHTNFYNTPDDYMHYYKGEHSPNNGSVWKSDVNSSYYRSYPDSSSVVSVINEATVKGVRVGIGSNPTTAFNGGSLGLQENQYVRFSTYTDKSSLNMKLKLYLDMVLKFDDGIEINLNDYALGSQIKHCQDANPPYDPLWGQFTVIDHELNKNVNDPANFYYNLRAQVSERPYKVDIVSLKESNTSLDVTQRNHWETLEGNTTIQVELADMLEFSDINASCGDTFNTIPGSVEFISFGLGSGEWKKPLTITSTAYARKNLAYRVWFLEDMDGHLIQHNCGNPASSGTCYRSIYATTFHANGETFCQTSCAPSDSSCYECLRGKYAKPLCSRDNFSIRPEAFDIEGLKDMNNSVNFFSTNTPNTLVPTDNSSGKETHHIAARYPYRLDINATGYCYKDGINTRGVPGYNNEFSEVRNLSSFKWFEFPLNSVACNDENDQNISLAFNNTPYSTSKTKQELNNIGKYTIALRDITWSNVDKDSNATHHNSPRTRNFFLGATDNKQDDCKLNEIFVPRINASYNGTTDITQYFVGCDFSSQYEKLDDIVPSCNPTAPYGVEAHTFNDYNVTSHPHHIDITLNNSDDMKDINSSNPETSTFIYMNSMINNIDNLNMSTYLDATLSAVARDASVLSNFTENCYSQGLDMNFSSTIWHYGGEHNLTYFVETLDANFSASANEINVTASANIIPSTMMSRIFITEKAFKDDMNGTADVKMYLNLDRNINENKNPFRVNFNTLNLGCAQDYSNTIDNPSDIMLENCNFTIDGLSKVQNIDYGLKDRNITFIYGRVHAPRYRIDNNNTASITLYYESYCDVPGGCRLLDGVIANNRAKHGIDSVKWYLNDKHDESSDGNITNKINQHRDLGLVTDDNPSDTTRIRTLTYNEGKGYPYRTVMEINTSNWLIYNRYDSTIGGNRFDIEFNKKGTDTTGTVDSNAAVNSNRRIMW